jgi:hypothetical protein
VGCKVLTAESSQQHGTDNPRKSDHGSYREVNASRHNDDGSPNGKYAQNNGFSQEQACTVFGRKIMLRVQTENG